MKKSRARMDVSEIMLDSLKGALSSTAISLVAVVIYALILKWTNASEASIPIVNTVIKVLSLGAGAFAALAKRTQKGWLKGLVSGFMYAVFIYVIFSLIDGIWAVGVSVLVDMLISCAISTLWGIALVNVIGKKKAA